MPTQEEIFNQIISDVSVTRPQIVAAKEFILNEFRDNKFISTTEVLQKFLGSIDGIAPEKVVVHPSVDSTTTIRQVIQNISWRLAFSEAIWALVHNNSLFQIDNTIYPEEPKIPWTSVIPGSGGYTSGWQFPQYKYSLPNQLVIAPSLSYGTQDYLIEPDLFLKHLNIDSMHMSVQNALCDAILCFRAELYTPALAMMVKAIEGAWLELGFALLKTLDDQQQQRTKKQSDILSSEYSSVAKIIRTVLELYQKQDYFSEVSNLSKIKVEDLRNAVEWADCVRESRNVVHYGNDPILPNDFEKVATLLLGAPTHFKLIYNLIDTCSQT